MYFTSRSQVISPIQMSKKQLTGSTQQIADIINFSLNKYQKKLTNKSNRLKAKLAKAESKGNVKKIERIKKKQQNLFL